MNETSDIDEEVEQTKSESEVSPPQSAGASATGAIISAATEINERIGKRRWMICAKNPLF